MTRAALLALLCTTAALAAPEFTLKPPPGWHTGTSSDPTTTTFIGPGDVETLIVSSHPALPGIKLSAIVDDYADSDDHQAIKVRKPVTLDGVPAERVRLERVIDERPLEHDAVFAIHNHRAFMLELTQSVPGAARKPNLLNSVLATFHWRHA